MAGGGARKREVRLEALRITHESHGHDIVTAYERAVRDCRQNIIQLCRDTEGVVGLGNDPGHSVRRGAPCVRNDAA